VNNFRSTFAALLKKEIKHQFVSGSGTVSILFFTIVVSGAFFGGLINPGGGIFRGIVSLVPFVSSFVIPIASMSIWSVERKRGTERLLASYPVAPFFVTLAKFIALMVDWIAMLLLCAPIALMPGVAPEPGILFATFAYLILFGAAAMAFGQFLSGLFTNAIAAYLASAASMLLLTFSQLFMPLASVSDGVLSALARASFAWHLDSAARGVFDSGDVLFFALPAILFLLLDSWRFSSGRIHK